MIYLPHLNPTNVRFFHTFLTFNFSDCWCLVRMRPSHFPNWRCDNDIKKMEYPCHPICMWRLWYVRMARLPSILHINCKYNSKVCLIQWNNNFTCTIINGSIYFCFSFYFWGKDVWKSKQILRIKKSLMTQPKSGPGLTELKTLDSCLCPKASSQTQKRVLSWTTICIFLKL